MQNTGWSTVGQSPPTGGSDSGKDRQREESASRGIWTLSVSARLTGASGGPTPATEMARHREGWKVRALPLQGVSPPPPDVLWRPGSLPAHTGPLQTTGWS